MPRSEAEAENQEAMLRIELDQLARRTAIDDGPDAALLATVRELAVETIMLRREMAQQNNAVRNLLEILTQQAAKREELLNELNRRPA